MHLFGRDSSCTAQGTISLSSLLDTIGSRSSEIVFDMVGGMFTSSRQEHVISYVSEAALLPALSVSLPQFIFPFGTNHHVKCYIFVNFCPYLPVCNLHEPPQLHPFGLQVCLLHRHLVGAQSIVSE